MLAPVARTDSAVIALMVPAVPTGMNAGVSISPWAVAMVPARAVPSLASMRKPKALLFMAAQQRRIAIRIEPVAGGDRVCVGLAHRSGSGERANQHEQRRPRQVKIGHQQISRPKPIPWQNEQRGLPIEWADRPAFGGGTFQ